MKLKNQELLDLRELLSQYRDAHNLKIAWMVAQNLHKISDYVKLMQDMLKATPAMEAFEEARKALNIKHAKKDASGNPMTRADSSQPSGRAYDIADMDAFMVEMTPLIEQHAQAQEDKKALAQKEMALLLEDVDFEPYTITPENTKIKSDSDDSVFDAKTMLMLLHCGILKE